MARLSVRDFPDDLHQLLLQAAHRNERSLEGETRYGLTRYLESLRDSKPEPLSRCQTWQRAAGQRLLQLFERLREDKVFEWNERSDLPHLAQTLGDTSPAALLNCVEGVEPLSFDLAKRIVDLYGCSLEWLISGTGTIFPYPEIGNSYHDFFNDALKDSGSTIKLVRLCATDDNEGNHPRHDGTLLMFRCKGDSKNISAGYCGRFYLNDQMGGSGDGNLKQFVKFLNGVEIVNFAEYNTDVPTGAVELGDHHPNFYLDLTRCSAASWLYPLQAGRSPGSIEWKKGYSYIPQPVV
ncbi:hypothetical protein ALQ19_200186 [Pseudomonas syringae pv. berberidis]|nr:hypothetical protein ALQ19_200186 [Pseudomonas syringae pv. berberidis]